MIWSTFAAASKVFAVDKGLVDCRFGLASTGKFPEGDCQKFGLLADVAIELRLGAGEYAPAGVHPWWL